MKMKILVGAALALACGSALAGPGPGPGPGHGMHAGPGMGCPMMDAKSSPEERMKMRGEMFAMMDADKDGSVSRAEFDQHHDAMMKMHAEHGSEPAKPAEQGEHKH